MPFKKRIVRKGVPLKKMPAKRFRQRLTEPVRKPVYVKPKKLAELEKMHGQELVERARRELEDEFVEKTAVNIPLRKKVRFQPSLEVEVDPRVKGRAGFARDGAGNVIINVGGQQQAKKPKPAAKEKKAAVELPEKSFYSQNYGIKDSPENKARHLIESIQNELAQSRQGAERAVFHAGKLKTSLNPWQRTKSHVKFSAVHPVMAAKRFKDNVLHPRTAFSKSFLYNFGTYRGVKKQAGLTQRQHRELRVLGEKTVLLVKQAMKNYYFLKKRSGKTALNFVQQRLVKIKHDYEDQKNSLIHGLGTSTKREIVSRHPTGRHGIFGKRYEKHKRQRAERTKAGGSL